MMGDKSKMYCKFKPESTGMCTFLYEMCRSAPVLEGFICVQVVVLVIGMFAKETTQR